MSDTAGLTTLPSTLARSQATLIEAQRAVAEVQGAIMVAKSMPRDPLLAWEEMQDLCSQEQVANTAFFRFPRGGEQVSGPTIKLARALALLWGNLQYGIREVNRDDVRGVSEMVAFAWDMERNVRSETMFLVPHKRDRTSKAGEKYVEDITALRDIYENNANAGSRRVRAMIFAVLPPSFVEDAEKKCRETAAGDPKIPVVSRAANMIKHFAIIGVTREMLEHKLGRKAGQWSADDLSSLVPVRESILSGEATLEQEFPVAPITRDNLPDLPPPVVPVLEQPAAVAGGEQPVEADGQAPVDPGEQLVDSGGETFVDPADVTPDPVAVADATERQALRATLAEQFRLIGPPDLASALDDIRVLSARPGLVDVKNLAVGELTAVIKLMRGVLADKTPVLALDHLLDSLKAEQAEQGERDG